VGIYNLETALSYNLSGVMIRCTGLKYDLRLHKTLTYANYPYLNLISYTSLNGDSYDRFLLRINEMLESLFLINQIILKNLKNINHNNKVKKITINKLLKKNPIILKFLWKISLTTLSIDKMDTKLM